MFEGGDESWATAGLVQRLLLALCSGAVLVGIEPGTAACNVGAFI